jgi:hypothetical protein
MGADGDRNISDVRMDGVEEGDHAGYWERPSLNFFAEKNLGAEAELLGWSAWHGEYSNDGATARSGGGSRLRFSHRSLQRRTGKGKRKAAAQRE